MLWSLLTLICCHWQFCKNSRTSHFLFKDVTLPVQVSLVETPIEKPVQRELKLCHSAKKRLPTVTPADWCTCLLVQSFLFCELRVEVKLPCFYNFINSSIVLDAALLSGRKDKDEAQDMQKRYWTFFQLYSTAFLTTVVTIAIVEDARFYYWNTFLWKVIQDDCTWFTFSFLPAFMFKFI